MFHTLAPWRFVFHTLGPRGTPPPPPPYWDIFDQWEQGSTCNGLLWASIFGPAGRKYRYLFHFVQNYIIIYHCKFRVCAVCPFLCFHTVGFHPLERLEALRAFSHAGTALWRFHTLGPGGTPPPPPPYWEPPFTNRHVTDLI